MSLLQQYDIRTVIDVGVAHGTPWLYDAFPDTGLELIDPNPACAETMRQIASTRVAGLHHVAVGAQAGSLPLRVDTAVPSSSSFLPQTVALMDARAEKGDTRTFVEMLVPVVRLDDLPLADGPYLLKIDTEGYELAVIQGASAVLAKTAVVITETNVAQRFEGSYRFSALVAELDRHGFRLFDLLDVRTLGPSGPVNYLDAVFVRE